MYSVEAARSRRTPRRIRCAGSRSTPDTIAAPEGASGPGAASGAAARRGVPRRVVPVFQRSGLRPAVEFLTGSLTGTPTWPATRASLLICTSCSTTAPPTCSARVEPGHRVRPARPRGRRCDNPAGLRGMGSCLRPTSSRGARRQNAQAADPTGLRPTGACRRQRRRGSFKAATGGAESSRRGTLGFYCLPCRRRRLPTGGPDRAAGKSYRVGLSCLPHAADWYQLSFCQSLGTSNLLADRAILRA